MMLSRKPCSLCSCVSLAKKLSKNANDRRETRRFCSGKHPPQIKTNDFFVPMIDKQLRRRLFNGETESVLGCKEYENAIKSIKNITKTKEFDEFLENMTLFKRKTDRKNRNLPYELPRLLGHDIRSHFELIAENLVNDYKKLLVDFSQIETLPSMPKRFVKRAGWTKYDRNGEEMFSVDFPDDDIVVFDVETCVKEGSLPIMATAVSKEYWYSWCSKRLISIDNSVGHGLTPNGAYQIRSSDLIPFELKPEEKYDDFQCRKRIVIGHNVSFDRSFIKEQYFLKLRFFDTMCAHIALNGLAGEQRAAFLAITKGTQNKCKKPSQTTEVSGKEKQIKTVKKYERKNFTEDNSEYKSFTDTKWVKDTSMNSLRDIHKLYCGGMSTLVLDKAKRNIFVDGQIEDIRGDFDELMRYCAIDVAATFEVYRPLAKEMFERFPSPVTLFGMLEMSTAFLTVNENWPHYIQAADDTFARDTLRMRNILRNECNSTCNLLENDKYKTNLWLFNEDWSLKTARVVKKDTKRKFEETPEEFAKRFWNDSREHKTKTRISKFPNWHRKLLPKNWNAFDADSWEEAERKLHIIEDNSFDFDVTAKRKITPKVLRMVWNGYPLYDSKKYGWGYLKLNEEKLSRFDRTSFKLFEKKDIEFPLDEFVFYVRQNEHDCKLGEEERFQVLDEFKNTPVEFYMLPHKDGHGDEEEPENNVGNPLSKSFAHYVDQGMLRSVDPKKLSQLMDLSKQCSYWQNNSERIKEQIIIWPDQNMLPPNLQDSPRRVGIILPRLIVSGTVTRRAVEKTWMTVSNAKKDRIGSELKGIIQTPDGYSFVGADVDSQELWIAGLLGCTPIGYMILKGSKTDKTDQHTVVAEQLKITRDQAKILNYGRLYGAGLRFATILLQQFRPGDDKKTIKLLAENLYEITKGEKKRKNLYSKDKSYSKTISYWVNGSESDLFNCLEKIARSERPETPVLKCRISKALEPKAIKDQFLPSRVNWIIQSSAVDFLHSMLTCMRWLCDEFNIDARFAISVHDEVRYFVKDEDKYRAALALQITNLLTRAFFVKSVGMCDLPESVAYFSRVDIDKVLRKEVDDDNVTPSNPLGLEKCYGIPLGEALTMNDIVKKTRGSLRKDHKRKQTRVKAQILEHWFDDEDGEISTEEYCSEDERIKSLMNFRD